MRRTKYIFVATAAMLLAAACGGGGTASIEADALVVAGSGTLTRSQLHAAMPAGLSAADSTTFARAYIREWIDARLIADVAAEEVDRAEIERLVEEYRNSLIMAQYRRSMARKATDGIFSEDTLKAYYDAHPDDFILDRPLVKGIYLKVPDDTKNLSTLRRLYKSEQPADIDRLEKAALGEAIHYDYFRDRWIDWEQIETRIPVDFSSADMADMRSGKPVDVTSGGFVYLLSVSDYLPVGSPMPFEAAKPYIRERMLSLSRIDYDKRLRNELLNKALADGTISFPGANPLK